VGPRRVAERDPLLQDVLAQPVEDPRAARQAQPAEAPREPPEPAGDGLEPAGRVREPRERGSPLDGPRGAAAPRPREDPLGRPPQLERDRAVRRVPGPPQLGRSPAAAGVVDSERDEPDRLVEVVRPVGLEQALLVRRRRRAQTIASRRTPSRWAR
jgi:hypothetical protein